jgi:hypothetical protein
MIVREDHTHGQPIGHIDVLCRAAELQGEMWARTGCDVHARLRRHAPGWPGDRSEKMRLILAALAAGRRREDPVFIRFAALTSWGGGRGRDDLALAELITSFHTGWFAGSAEWSGREGGDR